MNEENKPDEVIKPSTTYVPLDFKTFSPSFYDSLIRKYVKRERTEDIECEVIKPKQLPENNEL